MFTKLSQKGLLTHVFFFSLFLVIPALAFIRLPGEPFFSMPEAFVRDMLANCVLLGFFYLNYYLLIPKFFFQKKYIQYALYTALFLAASFSVAHLIAAAIPSGGGHPPPFDMHLPGRFSQRPEQNDSILHFILLEFRRHLYLFFTAVFFSFLLRTREHLSQLKEEKLETELASLKAQINPHFLFNTLNSIYALSVKKDDKASEAIVHLSGLMRYAIKEAHADKIALQKEIEYITYYIELQKARLGNTARVHFTCSGDPANKEIVPLILMAFIENAFKYGVNPDVADCSVEIVVEITEKGIRLQTFNKKVQITAASSTGIGLKTRPDV